MVVRIGGGKVGVDIPDTDLGKDGGQCRKESRQKGIQFPHNHRFFDNQKRTERRIPDFPGEIRLTLSIYFCNFAGRPKTKLL